jgi:hypothetical protein
MQLLGHPYAKKSFLIYLKVKFNFEILYLKNLIRGTINIGFLPQGDTLEDSEVIFT